MFKQQPSQNIIKSKDLCQYKFTNVTYCTSMVFLMEFLDYKANLLKDVTLNKLPGLVENLVETLLICYHHLR